MFPLISSILVLAFSTCGVSPQIRSTALATARRPPVVERITSSLYRVGGALVDMRARSVTCRGAVNMDRGPIEYLAVAPNGKLHESLLRVDVRPLHLQVALLLLGIEPKNVLAHQGETKTPQGDPVSISVRWHDTAGKQREVRAADWVETLPEQQALGGDPWVFTGSRILKEGFEADLSQSLVAVWHDPAAILDNRSPAGAQNGLIVFESRVPRRGTVIELVIRQSNPAPGHASGGQKQP